MYQRSRDANEIIGMENIEAVVDEFYNRIQTHPTLAKPFEIVKDWPEHKHKLAHFWWLSLGGEPYADYQYAVGPKHMVLDIDGTYVDDWLELFYEVMSNYLPEDLVEIWHGRARNMGRSIRMLLQYKQPAQSISTAAQELH